jgi:hypothetical protein
MDGQLEPYLLLDLASPVHMLSSLHCTLKHFLGFDGHTHPAPMGLGLQLDQGLWAEGNGTQLLQQKDCFFSLSWESCLHFSPGHH